MSTADASFSITDLSALEILDSRGNPTLQVDVTLTSGVTARAGSPQAPPPEAARLSSYATAMRPATAARASPTPVANVNGELRDLLGARTWTSLAQVDGAMIEADGTENKSRLGANAIVGVSMAVARALATGGQLFEYLAPGGVAPRLPVPHFNVLNGGAHAPNSLDFQEFMVAPIGAPSMPEAVRAGAAVYAKLRGLLQKAGFATGLGRGRLRPGHHPTGRRARPAGAGDR
jgi:enolase